MTEHEFTYTHSDETDREYEWTITFTYTPGDPGRLNALPENCWPSEPAEIEITSIAENDLDISGRAFSSDLNDKIEIAAWEYLDNLSQNFDPT